MTNPAVDPVLLSKLLARVKHTDAGCMEWTGWRVQTGYGQFYYKGRTRGAHRLMHQALHGPIPAGLRVLHKCDNPPCLNPDHLELGTDAKNMRQSVERRRHFEAVKTHCDRGHELSGEDVYIAKDGSRHCKVCGRARHRINVGWPEDLAYSAPKGYVGHVPPGLKRIKPPIKRPHGAPHCTKGHALEGRNRYVTPQGNIECRTCRQIARARYARNYQAKTPQSDAEVPQ